MSRLEFICKKEHRPETMDITPVWISELKSDDIFMFGYRQNLGEGMEVVNQVIWNWWRPRFLLNHLLKTAYEWMISSSP